MVNAPEDECEFAGQHADDEETPAEDIPPGISEIEVSDHNERLARWLRREIARIKGGRG